MICQDCEHAIFGMEVTYMPMGGGKRVQMPSVIDCSIHATPYCNHIDGHMKCDEWEGRKDEE